jgi:hypothetical protein
MSYLWKTEVGIVEMLFILNRFIPVEYTVHSVLIRKHTDVGNNAVSSTYGSVDRI